LAGKVCGKDRKLYFFLSSVTNICGQSLLQLAGSECFTADIIYRRGKKQVEVQEEIINWISNIDLQDENACAKQRRETDAFSFHYYLFTLII